MSDTVRAVLCEIEGVLAETTPLRTAAMRDALAASGVAVSPAELQAGVRGRPATGAVGVLARHLRDLDETQRTIIALEAERRFSSLLPSGVRLAAGAVEFVQRTRVHVPVAAVTRLRRDDAHLILDLAGLTASITFVIAREDVVSGKPDPGAHELALRRLAQTRPLRPDEAIALEDGGLGIDAARTAGVHVVAVGELPAEETIRAGAWIPSLEEHDLRTLAALLELERGGVR